MDAKRDRRSLLAKGNPRRPHLTRALTTGAVDEYDGGWSWFQDPADHPVSATFRCLRSRTVELPGSVCSERGNVIRVIVLDLPEGKRSTSEQAATFRSSARLIGGASRISRSTKSTEAIGLATRSGIPNRSLPRR